MNIFSNFMVHFKSIFSVTLKKLDILLTLFYKKCSVISKVIEGHIYV